jgi:hypothetical protein
MLKNRQLPAFRVDSDWRFHREKIDQYLFAASNVVQTERAQNDGDKPVAASRPEKRWRQTERSGRPSKHKHCASAGSRRSTGTIYPGQLRFWADAEGHGVILMSVAELNVGLMPR